MKVARIEGGGAAHLATKDGLVTIYDGQIFDDKDPIVKAYPGFFVAPEQRVETATAAPGAVRKAPRRK